MRMYRNETAAHAFTFGFWYAGYYFATRDSVCTRK